jgi:hypothetical protein
MRQRAGSKHLKRFTSIFVVLGIVAAAIAAITVHTFTVHCVNDALVAEFKVTGLGNVPSANFKLEAEAVLVVTCINRGGNKPPGQIRTISARAKTGTFPVRNGQTTGTLMIAKPSPSEFQHLCPNGFAATEVDVLEYRNIKLIGPSGQVLRTISVVRC